MNKKFHRFSRRQFAAGSGAVVASVFFPEKQALANINDRKFIFVICAAGGASIIDSFLAQTNGPAAYSGLIKPEGSAFSACPVLNNSIQGAIPLGNRYSQANFLKKHGSDMVVMTCQVSSVNHQIAAKRAMTGDNVYGGRTIVEAVAAKYGEGLPLANLMLAGGGYAAHGDDQTVPDFARAQIVADPHMFAFATHGSKGISDRLTPRKIDQLRSLRRQVESVAQFERRHQNSPLLQQYLRNRERVIKMLEGNDTITKLMILDAATSDLESFKLQTSPDFNQIHNQFPNLATDPLEARTALAFLAVKNQLSNAVSIAPTQNPLIEADGSPNSPIAFDWSHVDHRGAQNAMWSYLLKNVDSLISLLKATDYNNDPSQGKLWDRSLIYIATEFGRDKVSSGGSGHHLNNGVVMISPLLKGNRVYGGVDAARGLTYGFDPSTGAALTGSHMTERDVYSAVAMALGIRFTRQRDLKIMMKNS